MRRLLGPASLVVVIQAVPLFIAYTFERGEIFLALSLVLFTLVGVAVTLWLLYAAKIQGRKINENISLFVSVFTLSTTLVLLLNISEDLEWKFYACLIANAICAFLNFAQLWRNQRQIVKDPRKTSA